MWETYPDAANDIDEETKLPAFALPSRLEDDRNIPEYFDDGTSITFFLLRQRPEMLAIALGGSQKVSIIQLPDHNQKDLATINREMNIANVCWNDKEDRYIK